MGAERQSETHLRTSGASAATPSDWPFDFADLQDADRITSECGDLIAQHARDASKARPVVIEAMLGDQPLPLKASV
jgi:hypothetical protein